MLFGTFFFYFLDTYILSFCNTQRLKGDKIRMRKFDFLKTEEFSLDTIKPDNFFRDKLTIHTSAVKNEPLNGNWIRRIVDATLFPISNVYFAFTHHYEDDIMKAIISKTERDNLRKDDLNIKLINIEFNTYSLLVNGSEAEGTEDTWVDITDIKINYSYEMDLLLLFGSLEIKKGTDEFSKYLEVYKGALEDSTDVLGKIIKSQISDK